MHRTLLLGPAAALLAVLAAVPAAAQRTIAAGQTVSGRIDATDPRLDDDSHYEIWTYNGRAGERLTITLRSEDFDAYLAFGRNAGADCEECETDDDGAGDTDARITTTLTQGGAYQIRVNTLSAGETGSYTLSVESGEAPVAQTRPIALGQTVTGTLDASDAQAGDDSYYELWSYRGTPGQNVVITLRSSDFDAYVAWGRLEDGEWREIESDDDGAGGTDARLEVTVGREGGYVIRANTLSEGETGSYTLTVERADAAPRPRAEAEPVRSSGVLRAGPAVSGRLEESDARLDDGSFYDGWTYQGRAGERLVITMRSDAFDTFVSIGTADGGEFTPLESGDDGAGGTDTRLEVTLPETRAYLIRANSLSGGATGAYTLQVESNR